MAIRQESSLTIEDLPIVCYDNVVTTTNVHAESDPDFPASNVANPSTAEKWKHDAFGSPADATEYFTIDTSQSNPINYIAIAGHNFGSEGIAVGIELASFNSPIGGAESIFEPQIPEDDSPLVFLFTEREVEGINIIINPGSAQAQMAVVYAGIYTVFEQGISPEHVPLPYARVDEVVTGKSESGQFLGRIRTGGFQESTASIGNLSQSWTAETLIPFLQFASEEPFFWLPRPVTNPEWAAYAWLTNEPQPSIDVDGYVSIDLAMRGVSS